MADSGDFCPENAPFSLRRGIDIALASPSDGAQHRSSDREEPGRFCVSPANPFADRRRPASKLEEHRHASQAYPARQGPRRRHHRQHCHLCDAAKLLTDKKIGALVVKDKSGKLSGIISERDLVHAIAESGAAALTDPVERPYDAGAANLRGMRHGGKRDGNHDPRPFPPCAGAG